jgi:hypothetical protein
MDTDSLHIDNSRQDYVEDTSHNMPKNKYHVFIQENFTRNKYRKTNFHLRTLTTELNINR